jgi:hypothetical protein
VEMFSRKSGKALSTDTLVVMCPLAAVGGSSQS